ncbi:MAG: formate--tetrahydrofolate ligase, partial [Clostridia bacterium]|nr:formate--tetrahydrofolate ligase [Clostridia bacterium]
MMKDIEIARNTKLDKIVDVAKYIGISEEEIEQYGKYKCKIENEVFSKLEKKQNGKLILVTAISPTPLGEGKTTISIAIADGLRKINKKSILALREPSLGPVFGIKGGATGGGRVQVAPMEDINLHFTGDIHAITVANNLLSSMIDNHIYFGNELGFKRVVWKRCLDLNDRQLREIETGLSQEKNIVPRHDKFDITVASEIMAILCLAENLDDLKEKLGNILVGYNKNDEPIYAKDLKAQGAMTVLLKDAIKPNLVQTLEHTPAIIHGGPFANIAHGCNSVRATRLALKLGDYVITEAGFGADLGAEKFLNIKCRKANLKPDAVVLVATIKALKYHGGVEKENIQKENVEGLSNGLDNLYRHIDNLKEKFGLNVIVALNKYNTDTDAEIKFLKDKLKEKNIELSLVEGWLKGGEGAIDIARKLVNATKEKCDLNFTYNLTDSIKEKIEKVSTKIYGAKGVEYSEEALKEIDKIEKLVYGNLPVCIAKTQYSFSDNPKNLECKDEYNITVRNVELKAGAGFIVVLAGKIMTMPGLPKIPAAESIDIDNDGNVVRN